MKQPQLTEEEREIWKKAYDLHEMYCEGGWDLQRWDRFAKDLAAADYQFHHHPLMSGLLVAIYDWLEAKEKDRQTHEPEQMRMTGAGL